MCSGGITILVSQPRLSVLLGIGARKVEIGACEGGSVRIATYSSRFETIELVAFFLYVFFLCFP